MKINDSRAPSAMLAEVAKLLEADLDVFATDIEDRVLAQIGTRRLSSLPALKDYVRRGVLIGVRDALARLHSEVDGPHDPPSELIRLARLVGEQEPQLTDLCDAWLAGLDVFWDRFATAAERTVDDKALRWDVVSAARAQLSGYAARLFELLRPTLEQQGPASASPSGGSQLDAVSRALGGLWVDSNELGYNLLNNHIAVIADTSTPLEMLADRTGRQLLKVEAPGGGLWAWLGGYPRLSDTDLDELLVWLRSREGRVAFGDPADGLSGFSLSHKQALEASNIARATDQRVVRFADVRLLIAVMRDTDLAKGFIERELGELEQSTERMDELRATLRVYLEQGQNVSTTAALRHRDRKTILRQLRSAERLIHHYVCVRSDELLIALRAAEILRRGRSENSCQRTRS